MVSKFEIRKVFNSGDMPIDVMKKVCNEIANGTAVKVYLVAGYGHGCPLTRKWLLENGAEESDGFVLVWVEW